MEELRKDQTPEEDENTECKPLTDEEFAELQRKDRRRFGIISAIWDAILAFFS